MYSLDLEKGKFSNLLSLSEAAEIWGIEESTIRKAIATGRLYTGLDCRKFGKQWVITADAMARIFKGGWQPWSEYLVELRKAKENS